MADLIPLRPITTAQAPRVNLSSGEIAAPFNDLARAVGAVGEAAEAGAEKLATKAGEEAGRNSVRTADDGSLVVSDTSNPFIIGKAGTDYERAAKMTQAARIQPQVETDMLQLRLAHPNDPGGFKAAATAYSQKTLQSIQDPNIRGAVGDMLVSNAEHNERTALTDANAHNTAEYLQSQQATIKDTAEKMDLLARQGAGSAPVGSDAYKTFQAKAKDLAAIYNGLQADPRVKFSAERAQLELDEHYAGFKVQEQIGIEQRKFQADPDKNLLKAKQSLYNAFWGDNAPKNLTVAQRDHGFVEGVKAITNTDAIDREGIQENRKAVAKWLADSIHRPGDFDLGQANNLKEQAKRIGDTTSIHEIDERIRFQPYASAFGKASPNEQSDMFAKIKQGIMPEFGVRSKGVDENLLAVATRAQQISGIQFGIGDKGGMRDQATQDQLVAGGFSQTRNSNHLTGRAVDLLPVINGKMVAEGSPERHAEIARAMKQAAGELGVSINWGGDWHNFKDVAHFELPRDGAPAPRTNLEAADRVLHLTPQEKSLYERHLTNLTGTGGVDNPDGSRSTLFQTSFEANGKTYNIPTVWDGKILKPDDAIKRAEKEGLDKFPSYGSEAEAEARYEKMHQFMERDTGAYFARRNAAAKSVVPGQPVDLSTASATGRILEEFIKTQGPIISKNAETAFENIERVAKEGYPPNPDAVQHFLDMASRSGRDDLVKKGASWLAGYDAAAGRPPGETQSVFDAKIAEARKIAGDRPDAAFALDTLDHAKVIKDALDKQFAENPRAAAAARGWVGAPSPLQFSGADAPEIVSREKAARTIAQHVPNVGAIPAIMPDEAKQLATVLQSGDPKQAAGFLGALQASTSQDTWRATMNSEPVKTAMLGMFNSNVPDRLDTAGRTLDRLWGMNGQEFEAKYGTAAADRLVQWKGMQGIDAETRAKRMSDADDPNVAASRKKAGEAADEEFTGWFAWTPQKAADAIGNFWERNVPGIHAAMPRDLVNGDSIAGGAMLEDFRRAYKVLRQSGVEAGTAVSLAGERVHAQWQPTRLTDSGSTKLMRNAPETFYPADPVSKDHAWMQRQVEDQITAIHGGKEQVVTDETGQRMIPGWSFRGLGADPQTQREAASFDKSKPISEANRPPSYQVFIKDAKGQDQLLRDPNAPPGRQERFTWDPNLMMAPRELTGAIQEARGSMERGMFNERMRNRQLGTSPFLRRQDATDAQAQLDLGTPE